jgi:arylsulfatase A-like enzyme
MRILYLDLDTLRPDHLGCYGYERATSPNIDSVAREGVQFENYHCSDAPCLPSRAALMSGQFGIHSGVINHGGARAEMRQEGARRGFRDWMDTHSLVSELRWSGLRTVSVSPFAQRHAAWWFYSGFLEMYNTGSGGGESAEEITPTVLDWIERNGAEDDWFLHVNYWDPHTPYRAPEAFGNPFEKDPLPAWLTEEVLEKHRGMVGPHKAREIAMYSNRENPKHPRQPGELKDMTDLRRMIDGYDCGIRYMDGHIGQLFDALRKKGVFEDLAIIISSDHGENQGELGIYGEHATADRITTRIPMIVRWPGAKRGLKAEGLHYNLDLLPTLAEIRGRERNERWDGRSFRDTLFEGKDAGHEYLVLSQCAHVCQRSVRWGSHLWTRTWHDGYHLFPDEMLYNVDEDPHEQRDLAGERPDLCNEAAHKYLDWHTRMMETMPDDVDPMWTVIREGGPLHARGQLAEYCEYLKKTDREWAIPELKKRHPREFA